MVDTIIHIFVGLLGLTLLGLIHMQDREIAALCRELDSMNERHETTRLRSIANDDRITELESEVAE